QLDLLRPAPADDAKPRARARRSAVRAPGPEARASVSEPPDWYRRGLPHLWLPYERMKAPRPLAVSRTEGSRIILADGRVLIDGIASWWTACHGYNHPHIRDAVM